MNNKKITFVVGDKFEKFGQNEQVITLSALKALIRREPVAEALRDMTLSAGQGLSEADVLGIIDLLLARGMDASLLLTHPVRAGLRATHKRRIRNAIISSPRKLSSMVYEADLLVDERSELMNDHQTGLHIQGMLLVEAARQMFLAVTEVFFIGENNERENYVVINEMDIKYSAFVFPLGATLRYEILEQKTEDSERLYFFARISVWQADIVATEIMVKFTSFVADRIRKKEQQQAMTLLQKLTSHSDAEIAN